MEFEFKFPYPSGVLYDSNNNVAFIWGKDIGIRWIIDSISHEIIHDILKQIINEKTSIQLDKIAKKVEKWNKEIYNLIY